MDDKQLAAAENLSADVFHQILDLAITGKGALPGAHATAKAQLGRHGDAEAAIRAIVNQHLALAGGQGFATNWGGFLMSLVTIPANIGAHAFVQARMVSAIAHLRGYELEDPRVRTALLMCMLGPSAGAALVSKGVLPSSPLVVATAPVFDSHLDGAVAKVLLERAMSAISGKRLGLMLAKGVPFVGGGVGAAVDAWSTRAIARHTLDALPSRRPKA
ncbi:EcsC family protein [Tessaracoccus oleiagri]|uniref:EcsC protein family protein n=1 Tax=Tessaracoccus oleiagri TaxID=686624 RepID=A0A1G9HHA6_9ACTN|nr:EcsC family protein [Tessaracoccus oleiagri]SDL12176.1 EcsC protein family protein [Tessaracoccus oleiagri]